MCSSREPDTALPGSWADNCGCCRGAAAECCTSKLVAVQRECSTTWVQYNVGAVRLAVGLTKVQDVQHDRDHGHTGGPNHQEREREHLDDTLLKGSSRRGGEVSQHHGSDQS